jgi:YYY domain-containing protein
MASLLLWWLLSTVLAALALPLTMTLFRNLPDRGYPLARILGVLLVSFLTWFLGMWQLASFGGGLIAFCLLIVAGLSVLFLRRDRSIIPFLRQNWPLILFYELLFAIALLVGAVLRIYAPWGGVAIGHTEQPMDFALLNGIIQSRALPPQDPWLSGFGINYYYLGYFQAAVQTVLSGLPSSITFNLNLATLFALAVTGSFSLGYNLTRATDPAGRQRAILVGTLAALFAVLLGNQMGTLQVLSGSNQIAPLDAGEVWTVLSARLSGNRGAVDLGHLVRTPGSFGDSFESVSPSPAWQVNDFDWWWPSRVVWDERPSLEAIEQIHAAGQVEQAFLGWRRYVTPDQIGRYYAITEFPFFSFYLGDMHPHVMGLPLTLLAIALALNLLLAPAGQPYLGPASRWNWLFLVLHAVVLGSLYMANSWDFPTYLLLYGAARIWRASRDAGGPWPRRKALPLGYDAGLDLGLVAGLSIVLYLPFFATFRSLVGNKDIPAEILDAPFLGKLATLPGLSTVLRAVGPVIWDKTSLFSFIVIFGLFLYPALSWLAIQGVRRFGWGNLWGWAGLSLCLALAILFRFPLLLLIPVLILGLRLLKSSRAAEAMVLLMLLVALALALGCDLVYIRDMFESRMNTIFKFYYQIWILLAIAGAWAIGQLLPRLRGDPSLPPPRARWRPLASFVPWAVPLLLLLAGALVYPAMSLRLAFREQREWNLDGLAAMQKQYPGDYAGVQWLLQNTAPDAVVLEAVGPEWSYTGRVSAATGRPTLLGWDGGHEQQWRGGDPEALAEITGLTSPSGVVLVRPRREVVQEIYQTSSAATARQLLDQYGVNYVFVGFLESSYPPEGLAKFAQIGKLVFESPGVQIYRIAR